MVVHALNSYGAADYPDLRYVGGPCRFVGACTDLGGTLRLIEAPAAAPVDLADILAHLRVEPGADDVMVQAYVDAAVQAVEDRTGRALMPQTWEWSWDLGVPWRLRVPLAPLASVEAVGTRTAGGVETLMPEADYQVIAPSGPRCDRGEVRLLSGATIPAAPESGGVAFVRFVAGYGAADLVPAPLRAALRLIVGDLYANREATTAGGAGLLSPNPTVDALIAPYRILGGAR